MRIFFLQTCERASASTTEEFSFLMFDECFSRSTETDTSCVFGLEGVLQRFDLNVQH